MAAKLSVMLVLVVMSFAAMAFVPVPFSSRAQRSTVIGAIPGNDTDTFGSIGPEVDNVMKRSCPTTSHRMGHHTFRLVKKEHSRSSHRVDRRSLSQRVRVVQKEHGVEDRVVSETSAPTPPWFNRPITETTNLLKRSKNAMIRHQARLHGPLLRAVERGVTRVQLDHHHDNPAAAEQQQATFHGQPLVDLGTLGSLGLHSSERYRSAIVDAISKYGCTFPTSSQWIRHPFWIETTNLVSKVFERPCVLTQSTGLANMMFFSTFIRFDPSSTIIMDHAAHASLRDTGVCMGGVQPLATLKQTFDIKELETHMASLSNSDQVFSRNNSSSITWYVMDGMVSLTGQLPDVQKIWSLQRKYPDLWVFCDDAHGTGWSGTGGRGRVTDMVIREAKTNEHGFAEEAKRWVMSVCFGKSVGADGAALVLPNENMKDLVHTLSPFCTFTCTKFPFADLALINEAMKMSLDGTMDALQQELAQKSSYLHRCARQELAGLVDFPTNWPETPVLYIPIDRDMETFFDIVKTLFNEGIFIATCVPPATKSCGIRVTAQRESKEADIDRLLQRLKYLLLETAES